MIDLIKDNAPALLKGGLGIVATAGSAVVSILPQVEQWLRLASLCVGMCVGVVTIWSIIKKSRKD